jgi:hypothetical protein
MVVRSMALLTHGVVHACLARHIKEVQRVEAGLLGAVPSDTPFAQFTQLQLARTLCIDVSVVLVFTKSHCSISYAQCAMVF